jgi:alpha-galactosidase
MRFVDRHFAMTDGEECYTCSGEALKVGILLAMQYSGTGYNSSIRVLGDCGSTLYMIREQTSTKGADENGKTDETK